MTHQKKSRGHRKSKTVKSRQSYISWTYLHLWKLRNNEQISYSVFVQLVMVFQNITTLQQRTRSTTTVLPRIEAEKITTRRPGQFSSDHHLVVAQTEWNRSRKKKSAIYCWFPGGHKYRGRFRVVLSKRYWPSPTEIARGRSGSRH